MQRTQPSKIFQDAPIQEVDLYELRHFDDYVVDQLVPVTSWRRHLGNACRAGLEFGERLGEIQAPEYQCGWYSSWRSAQCHA